MFKTIVHITIVENAARESFAMKLTHYMRRQVRKCQLHHLGQVLQVQQD